MLSMVELTVCAATALLPEPTLKAVLLTCLLCACSLNFHLGPSTIQDDLTVFLQLTRTLWCVHMSIVQHRSLM